MPPFTPLSWCEFRVCVIFFTANFTMPEVSSGEFDEVQLLGSITEPQAAADIVQHMRISAQQQLQALQDAGWNYNCLAGNWQQQQWGGSCDLANNSTLSSSTSFGNQADAALYGPYNTAAAAAAGSGLPPSRSYSRNSSHGLYSPGNHSRRASSPNSSFSSFALPPAAVGGYGAAGFTTPWNPAHALYRPPSQQQSPAGQLDSPGVQQQSPAGQSRSSGMQQQKQQVCGIPLPPHAATAAAAAAAAAGGGAVTGAATCSPFQQYNQQYNSQYALPYDVAKQRQIISSYGQQQQQQQQTSPGLQLPPSSSLAGSRSPSAGSGSSFGGAGSMYVRQPSWVGPQAAVPAAAAAIEGGGVVSDSNGYTNPVTQSQQQQQQQQSGKPTVGPWSRSSKGWGTAASVGAATGPAAGTAQLAVDNSNSSYGPAPVTQADSEEFPSLTAVYASIVRSQPQTTTCDPQQKNEQQQEQLEAPQQQQQQQAKAPKGPVSPFAATACQAIEEKSDQQNLHKPGTVSFTFAAENSSSVGRLTAGPWQLCTLPPSFCLSANDSAS
jgi:hypothetical protein